MTEGIPVLWSDDINVDVVTPLAILRSQQGPLRDMTQGLLVAEMSSETTDAGIERHRFDLVAPSLDHYRYCILTASHEGHLAYPVTVEAECFENRISEEEAEEYGSCDWRPVANTEQEFIALVGEVFKSSKVRSVIHSLLARINERRNPSSSAPSDKPKKKVRQ